MIDDRVAWTSNGQCCYFEEGFIGSIISIDILTSFEGVNIGASNEIDDSLWGGNRTMERRDSQACIQLLDLPTNWLVQFYLINPNCVKGLVAYLEEM